MSRDYGSVAAHSLLVLDLVTVIIESKHSGAAPYAYFALLCHSCHGLFTAILEAFGDPSADTHVKDCKDMAKKIGRSIGFPLIASQITLKSLPDMPWAPAVMLIIPLTELICYYFMQDNPIDDKTLQASKIISLGFLVYASVVSNEKMGYAASLFYALAEGIQSTEDEASKTSNWSLFTALVSETELEEDSYVKKAVDFIIRMSRTIGFPLMATELSIISFPGGWWYLPIIHLLLPLTELGMISYQEDRWYSEEIYVGNKVLSVLIVSLAAFSCRNSYVFSAALLYLAAEIQYGEDFKDKPVSWCIPTAIADWLSTLVVFCSLFGLVPKAAANK